MCWDGTDETTKTAAIDYKNEYTVVAANEGAPRIQLQNAYSYFSTLYDKAADWTALSEADVPACENTAYVTDRDAAAIKSDAATAALTAYKATYIDVATGPIVATGKEGETQYYTYGSDNAKIEGKWASNASLSLGTKAFPADFSFLYGTVSSVDTDSLAPANHEIGLGPLGSEAKDEDKNASLLNRLAALETDGIPEASLSLQSSKVVLGSTTFSNTETNKVTTASKVGVVADTGIWTWDQASPELFDITYGGQSFEFDEGVDKKADVIVGNGSETNLPKAYFAKL